MHPAFRLCWIALLVQPPASALLMGYGTTRRQRHGHGAGPMMLQSDKAPVAVADPAVADPEVAQKVRGVLAAAQHKYDIPADYVRMLDGFFLCYMLQVQKAGRSMDYFEVVARTPNPNLNPSPNLSPNPNSNPNPSPSPHHNPNPDLMMAM